MISSFSFIFNEMLTKYLTEKLPSLCVSKIYEFLLPRRTTYEDEMGYCSDCKESGFFCRTPNSGDDLVCPVCYECFEPKHLTNAWVDICPRCKIIFRECCSHADNGCTEDTYYAKLVTHYSIDGFKFSGMPVFSNLNEFKWFIETFTLTFTMNCWSSLSPLGRTFCPKAHYKYADKPEAYRQTGKCQEVTKVITKDEDYDWAPYKASIECAIM